ncbi:MAG: carboxypeptidase M32 [Leptospira sp.]|nr:carboxypeptidase M32 [Leptospira sp.]
MSFANYRSLYSRLQNYRDIQSVLQWDSEVMMPSKGREARSKQLSEMSRLTHELFTGEEFTRVLESAQEEVAKMPETDPLRNKRLRELDLIRYRRSKSSKLPTAFVQKLSEKTNLAQGIWESAKKNQKFSEFSSTLEELVNLAKEQADFYGYENEKYNALIDDYERGATADFLNTLFQDLKKDLIPLIDGAKSHSNPFAKMEKNGMKGIPVANQEAFCKKLPSALGLHENESRLDKSAHPFSTSLGPKDKRITTRYDELDPLSSVFGVMHEVGHSLYEAGLSEIEEAPHPIAEFLSLGVHESQSRLWENQVGRSHAFWQYYYPIALECWNLSEKDLPFDTMMSTIRSVSKSKIRVEADQLTYNLHIILRFEMERDLIAGKIAVKDLPEIWNAKMKDYFGLKIDNDAEGVLQDVHWCMAAFGYFPTYTLGNIYSAQLFAAFEKKHPKFHEQLAKTGDTSELLKWLRANVHHKGSEFSVDDLVFDATGEKPNSQALVAYLKEQVSS